MGRLQAGREPLRSEASDVAMGVNGAAALGDQPEGLQSSTRQVIRLAARQSTSSVGVSGVMVGTRA